MPLIDLVSKFMTTETVRRTYAQAPHQVLASYGVTERILTVLQQEGLLAAIAAELDAWRNDAGRGIHPLGWGVAAMKVTDFTPGEVDINVAFELTIEGEEFTPRTKAALVMGEHRMANAITASKTVFKSPTQIVGTFKLTDPGRYEVGAYRPARKGGLPSGSWLPGEKLVVGDGKTHRRRGKSATKKGGKKRS